MSFGGFKRAGGSSTAVSECGKARRAWCDVSGCARKPRMSERSGEGCVMNECE